VLGKLALEAFRKGHPTMDNFEILESEVRSYSRNWDTVFDFAAGSTLSPEDLQRGLDILADAKYVTGGPVTLTSVA
jgi:hypothetical protein